MHQCHQSGGDKNNLIEQVCPTKYLVSKYSLFILYSGFVSMRQSHYLVTTLVYNVWCYGYSFLPYQSVSLIAYL